MHCPSDGSSPLWLSLYKFTDQKAFSWILIWHLSLIFTTNQLICSNSILCLEFFCYVICFDTNSQTKQSHIWQEFLSLMFNYICFSGCRSCCGAPTVFSQERRPWSFPNSTNVLWIQVLHHKTVILNPFQLMTKKESSNHTPCGFLPQEAISL